jgi:multidrug efflux pump subunit AcrA (membrane-fusion protein)
VLEEGGRRAVWVVASDGKSVARRDVTVAEERDRAEAGRIAVVAGLQSGDRVVVAGVHSLKDGQLVRLTDDAV